MLAAALALGLMLGATNLSQSHRAQSHRASTTSPLSPDAKVEVDAARKAASAGDYVKAVAHFEAALAIQPLPQLQYNIAVCHHRRTIEATPDSAEYVEAKDAAIDAYNGYLALAPDAADREEVEANVLALGGQPPSRTDGGWTPELVHPDDVPDPPPFADPSAVIVVPPEVVPPEVIPKDDTAANEIHGFGQPAAGPQPAVATARVSLGAFLPVMLASPGQLGRSAELSAAPMLGLGLRAGGFLGNRSRINLGGELSVVGQPLSSAARHTLVGGWLGLTLRYDHPLGDRFRIGGGGLIAATGQNLRYTGLDPLRCGVRESGAVSQRTGILLAGRFVFAALLGRRQRHALTIGLTPGMSAHSGGSASQDEGDAASDVSPCRDEPDPFATFGLDAGPSLVVFADFGYALRL